MNPIRFVSAAIALSTIVAPLRAFAQSEASELFDEGIVEMKAGHFDKACPAIGESYRLDARPGTLFTLAECEAKRGRIATAFRRYSEYLDLFSRMPKAQQISRYDQEKVARSQKLALESQVPQLTVTLPKEAPAETVVKRDGEVLAAPLLGNAVAIDPGEYVFTTQAPGGKIAETRVAISKGEKKQIVLEFKALTEEKAKAAPPPAVDLRPASSLPAPNLPSPGPSSDGRRLAAYFAGGIGVTGLLFGGFMGGLALTKQGDIKAGCRDTEPGKALCTPTGRAAAESARTAELASTVGFGVGLTAVGVATVLWLLAPSTPKSGASSAMKKRDVASITITPLGHRGMVLGAQGGF